MDKNKRIITILIVLIIIFTILGSTFAYLSWTTNESQKTSVNFTAEPDFSCAADMGGGINQSNVKLKPTTVRAETVSNYIKRTMTVNATTSGRPIYMDLWLDVNTIGSGLSNSVNFKYALTSSSTSPTTGVVSSGNFNGKTAGSKVSLLSGKNYNATTTDTYYLWIWLDAAETSLATANQSFSLSLNGSCDDFYINYG